jgi:hypothetical protein
MSTRVDGPTRSFAGRIWILLLAVACAVSWATVFFMDRGTPPRVTALRGDESTPEPPQPTQLRARAVARVRPPQVADSVPSQDNSPRADADRVLEPVWRLASYRERQGLEAMANQADGYLRGMVETVRVLDPRVVTAMRDKFEGDICSGAMTTDRELMLYARLVMIDSGIGTSRGIDCAFRTHHREDIVLWTLLDSWNALGRPEIAARADIERLATDSRTRERLASAEEGAQMAARFMNTRRTEAINRLVDGGR